MEQRQELIDNDHRLSNLTVDEFDYYDIDRLNDTIIQEETTTTDEIQHSKYYYNTEITSSTSSSITPLFNVTILFSTTTTSTTTTTTTITTTTAADVKIHNSTLKMNDTYTIKIINDMLINNPTTTTQQQPTTTTQHDPLYNSSSIRFQVKSDWSKKTNWQPVCLLHITSNMCHSASHAVFCCNMCVLQD